MENGRELAGGKLFTLTLALAMPRCLAIFMPQARKLDHFLLRTRSECAAS